MFLYVGPVLFCQNCDFDIPLPYSDMPEMPDGQSNSDRDKCLIVLPLDEWSAIVGCRACGHLYTYTADHVGEGIVERANQGKFHNGTNCFSVGVRCGNGNCKAPATLHVNMHDGESERDLIRLLRTMFFSGNLPCGHGLLPMPESLYRDAHRVLERLW